MSARFKALGLLATLTLLSGGSLAVAGCHLQQSVRLYEQHWAGPQGASGGLRYVALGDSAAQGVGASSPQKGYVGLLAERLRQTSGEPVEVFNISHSGAKIEDVVRDQLPRLQELNPDIVTVDVGANDITHWDRDRFAASVATLCAALPAGKTVIADVPSFMHFRWRQRSLDAARIVTEQCESHGVRVAKLFSAIERKGVRGMFTLYAADWFHPNDRGYRVWADAFWVELREVPHQLKGDR